MHDFVGELVGTFILVFFGCSAVAVAVLFSSHVGLFQVAIVWGLAVTLAIYATRHLSCAHINPAVSLAMVVGRADVNKGTPRLLGSAVYGRIFGGGGALYYIFQFNRPI